MLIDIIMPQVSGIDLLTFIRERKEWNHIPILMLSAEISETCTGRSWHDALYDAVASLYILRTLIDQSNLANLPISALTSQKRRI